MAALTSAVVAAVGFAHTTSNPAVHPAAGVQAQVRVAAANDVQTMSSASRAVSVTTYHNDNRRTGWNPAETVLIPGTVAGTQFRLVHSIALDEQVDAQPLILTGQPITGQGTHDVVYVATENNTIYAIDASSGVVLLTKNYGPPVPIASLPGRCSNNSSVVGISSTPAIDPVARVLYAITYTFESNRPVYRVHALDPSTLDDRIAPQVVLASAMLADNSVYSFEARVSRQRAALLVANGNVYAAFSSFCDMSANSSRGWILGWNTGTLAPLAHNHLDDSAVSTNYFLTSVWMSGYGLALAGNSGSLYFVTGNSDPSGTAYDPLRNLSESVVKLSPDLASVQDYFTPFNFANLERDDRDFGSGGVMTLPNQPGTYPYLAAAAGKDGRMFLMNRASLGQFTPDGPNRVIGTFAAGQCWCGPSNFAGADGIARIISSGGNQIIVWRLQTSPATTLIKEHATAVLPTGLQDPGSFTTISSYGKRADTAIIWTVRRPTDNVTREVVLYAFDASTGATLSAQTAGTWPHLSADANIVPTVANGRVYVASYKQLTIFGLAEAGTASLARTMPMSTIVSESLPEGGHRVSGVVVSVDHEVINLSTRGGKQIRVLMARASQLDQAVPIVIGGNVEAQGSLNADGVFDAQVITHAKLPGAWLPDR